MKLALFDIDGTILLGNGAGRRALGDALREAFGGVGPPGHPFDGKTDRQIVRELMRLEGNDDAAIDERMDMVLARYLDALHAELDSGECEVTLLPGVRELLDALEERDDVTLGLLTGNVAAGAAAKLAAAGIDVRRFVVAAYGSDHESRPELPAIAQRRARELLGRSIEGERLVIIGDTPADVDCGRALGARAIAVATGRYGVAELAEHEPAAVFADLTDTAAVVCAILAD